MISFGRKHCKYDMHTYFHASFLGIAFKSFVDDIDYTAQSFIRTVDSLYVSIHHYLQHVCFYIISYLCVIMHLFSVWRSKILFFVKKLCFDFDFISLNSPVIIWPCHILNSEHYHRLFKH